MAGLDTRILLGAQGVQAPDALQGYQQAMTLSSLANAQELQRQQLRDKQRADEEHGALRSVMGDLQAGGYSDESILAAMQKAPQAGPAILKAAQEARKAKAAEGKDLAETDAKRVTTSSKRFELFGGIAGNLAQQPTRENWLAAKGIATRLGLDPAVLDVPEGMNPQEYFANVAQQSIDHGKQVEIRDRGLVREQTALRDTNTNANNVADRDQRLTVAQMADQRAREFNAAARAQAAAQRAQADATRDGAVDKRTTDVEMKLADDYRTQSKGFQEVSGSLKKINTALDSATTNAGSALAAGTAFMKLLDPNSVVRESELGMALNASGWMDRARNVFQVMQSGKVMTPLQVKNLRESAQALFAEAAATQRQIDAGYTKRAKDYGANPERIIMDFGQVEKPKVAAPKLGEVRDGYLYKGGDPSQQSSWEKVNAR